MSLRALQRFVAITACIFAADLAAAAGLYSQIVIPFPTERTYTYVYNRGEHSLVLDFQKTSPSELAPIEQYDERIIRRVLIKDLGPSGTEVKLVLRDRDVRTVVTKFTEPFRIAIDLFDADYEEERDPQTGLPLVAVPQKKETNAAGAPMASGSGGVKLLMNDDGSARSESRNAGDISTNGKTNVAANEANTLAGKRRLLQPTPELFNNLEELQGAMREAAEGVGKAWKDFPPYVYRIQTAAYEEGLGKERQVAPAAAAKALSSAETMADYAGKLYNFGHEAKALIAYQQVLHRDPSIFDRDALHLWKFAEVHLGQGNMTLASGYLQALLEKHPESPLANFARLRLLDIESVRYLAQGHYEDVPNLLPRLAQIKLRHNGELAAQIALRQAWWDKTVVAKSYDATHLPKITAAVRNELAEAYPQVESSHTAFLAASLLLSDMLSDGTPWQRGTGPFAESYFKRFSGQAAEPYRGQLKDELQNKLNLGLQTKVESGKLLEAIADYEALPATLRSIKKTPKTAWSIAEAYRKLNQSDKAIEFYTAATKTETEGPDRFKALFWLSVTAGELAEQLRKDNGNQDRISQLAKTSRDADRDADAAWTHLKESERLQVSVAYKGPFEKTVSSTSKLRTGPRIVLANWTKALTTKTSTANGGEATDWARSFSPSGSAVILLTDLGKRFAELGMPDERRAAISLLKHMKPKEFEDDKAAKGVWANELVNLAEDLRKSNEYLDAGKIYSLVGTESENWEGRAEALYKGGLLLYRAGRRAEAIDSFKKASDDGNNLFYANLAKERLSQLQ